MIESYIEQLASNTSVPIISSFFIGLLTAISPCTFAANAAAISYISHHADVPKKSLLSTLLFSMGRIITYFSIGGIMIFTGTVIGEFARNTQTYGNLVMGPILIATGLLFAGVFDLNLSFGGNTISSLVTSLKGKGLLSSLFLGILFGFAFCPYSGLLFFGLLMPMALSSSVGATYPIIFGIGVNVPVLIFGALLYVGTSKAKAFGRFVTHSWKYVSIVSGWALALIGCYYLAPYISTRIGLNHAFWILSILMTALISISIFHKNMKRQSDKKRNVIMPKIKKTESIEKIHATSTHEKDLDNLLSELESSTPPSYFNARRRFENIELHLIREGISSRCDEKKDKCSRLLSSMLEDI